jgi:glutathione S-transferase
MIGARYKKDTAHKFVPDLQARLIPYYRDRSSHFIWSETMQPVLFYGVPMGCSFGSIVALEWLRQPYRLCRVNMPEDLQRDFYDQINPVRTTPTLRLEDGRMLSQSAAILLNLARRSGAQSLGFTPGSPEQDRLTEVLAFLNTTFFSAFSPLWKAYEMESNPPVQRVLREVGREDVAEAHAALERILGNRPWLGGESPTVADAYFIGIARWATYHQVLDQRAYPNVYRLIQKLESDPAVVFANAIEQQQSARSSGGFKGHVSLEELFSIHTGV